MGGFFFLHILDQVHCRCVSHWVRVDFLGIFRSVNLRSRIKGNQEIFSLVSARHKYRIITANERGYLTYRQGAGNGRRK